MRYLFLLHALLVVAVISIGGIRGSKFDRPPVEIFPDMDRMDHVRAQTPSAFFADGMASREPVEGTVPIGHQLPNSPLASGAHPSLDGFTALDDSYLNTGRFGDFWGTGLPEELGLTNENIDAFLRRGQERYNIYCAICHGESGNGQGVIRFAGFANIANLHDSRYQPENYADGDFYDAITHGRGLMGAYGDKLTIRDRWAVLAWTRLLQETERGIAADDPAIRELVPETPDTASAD